MPPSPSTCVACGQRFVENGELAAIPDATKIAFDPAHHRAWRICASCGEWNLLGADASAAALPELEARFTAAPKGPTPEVATVGPSLEMLRVGAQLTSAPNEVAALKRRRQIEWRTKLLLGGLVLYLIYNVKLFVDMARKPFAEILDTMPAALIGISSIYYVASAEAARHGTSRDRVMLRVNIMAFALGWLVVAWRSPTWLLALPMVVIASLLAGRFVEPAVKVKVKLPDGSALKLDEYALSSITLGWTADPIALSLYDLPRNRALDGVAAVTTLRAILKKGNYGHPSITEPAYHFFRSVGGLAGLLHALEGFRRDQDGRVVLNALPDTYQLALDMALAESDSAGSSRQALTEQVQEAARIAEIAEDLDRPLT